MEPVPCQAERRDWPLVRSEIHGAAARREGRSVLELSRKLFSRAQLRHEQRGVGPLSVLLVLVSAPEAALWTNFLAVRTRLSYWPALPVAILATSVGLAVFVVIPVESPRPTGDSSRLLHHAGVGDRRIGQGFFAPVVGVRQPLVVQAELVQDRGQQVGQLTRPSTAW